MKSISRYESIDKLRIYNFMKTLLASLSKDLESAHKLFEILSNCPNLENVQIETGYPDEYFESLKYVNPGEKFYRYHKPDKSMAHWTIKFTGKA